MTILSEISYADKLLFYQYVSVDHYNVTLREEGEPEIFDDLSTGVIRVGAGSDWLALETSYGFGLESAEDRAGYSVDLSEVYGIYVVPGVPVYEWLEIKFPLGYSWVTLSDDRPDFEYTLKSGAAYSYGVRGLLSFHPFAIGVGWMRWGRDSLEMDMIGFTLEFRQE